MAGKLVEKENVQFWVYSLNELIHIYNRILKCEISVSNEMMNSLAQSIKELCKAISDYV